MDEYEPKMTSKLAAYLQKSDQGKTTEDDRLTPRLRGYLTRSEQEAREDKSRAEWDASIFRLKKYTRRYVNGRRRRKTKEK